MNITPVGYAASSPYEPNDLIALAAGAAYEEADYLEAIRLHNLVLAFQRVTHPIDTGGIIKSLHEIATCYFAIGNYAESRTHYLEAVSLRQTPWDLTDSDLFSVLQGLSSCCYLRTDCSSEVALSEALYYARQALDVARNARGCDLQVVLHRVAKYLCLQGHNGEAIPFLLEGLALEQRVPGDNISNCISYLVMIADCYYQETNYDQALNFYLQLRAAIEQAEIPNITDMTDCLNGLGDCHYARGDYQNALDVYNQAFVLALQEGDTEIVEELRSKISTTQAELEHLI